MNVDRLFNAKGDRMTTNKEIILWPSEACLEGDLLWLTHGKINALFKCDLKSKIAQLAYRLKEERSVVEGAVSQLINTDRGVYIIPLWNNHIHFFDTQYGEGEIIHIPDEELYRERMLFCGAFYYRGRIICIPQNYRYILSIDVETNLVEVDFDLGDYFAKNYASDVSINRSEIDKEGVVYAATSNSNTIFKYDVASKEASVIPVGDADCKYINVVVDGNILYACDQMKKAIYVYDIKNSEVVQIMDVPLDSFCIRKLKEDVLLIDSFTDAKYYILREGRMAAFESSACNEHVACDYSYKHGVVIYGENDNNLYFDRCSYGLRQVGDDGLIKDDLEYFKAEINTCDFPILPSKIIVEDEVFDLNWMIHTL